VRDPDQLEALSLEAVEVMLLAAWLSGKRAVSSAAFYETTVRRQTIVEECNRQAAMVPHHD
jgi:hypothetical protein